jgi:TldD protein
MNMPDAEAFLCGICDLHSLEKIALTAFYGGHRGELFLEYKEDEILKIEDGIAQAPGFNFKRGFGLRSFKDDVSRYSYSSSLESSAVKKAVTTLGCGENSSHVHLQENIHDLYDKGRFINTETLENKIKFLRAMESYARSRSQNIRQVSVSLFSSWQVVGVVADNGCKSYDIRPLLRLSISIVVEKNGNMESGAYSSGGRYGYEFLLNEDVGRQHVDEALRQAMVKMQAVKAPAGEMPVVLGNSWTGILLHEAIGHGLEGDAIRKKTSSFHNLLGEVIAAPDVTVVDDGTIAQRRGSINIDDEGTASQRTVLIENGKLVGVMQDRMNAALLKSESTGNGRRESYEHMPLPRMTNTFMANGNYSFDEIVSRVKSGVFAKSFADGQVDIASGKFVFSASEAYLIKNGKISTPLKGAMLIGDGPSILKKISMVGGDFSLDPGIGTCGKDGQWVPVGVGEPSVLIDKITVGGAIL